MKLQHGIKKQTICSPSRNFPSTLIDVLEHCDYFPSVKTIITIAFSLPVTTCAIERSFNTLRRVKTWLRATISESRLSGLCMMSLHRKKIQDETNKTKVIENIKKFGSDKRWMQFLLAEW